MDKIEKPFIIPIFISHKGCPHRCSFCNQTAITGAEPDIPSSEAIRLMVSEFLSYKKEQRKTVQISFYGGNFLGLKENDIVSLLQEAARFTENGSVDSIRFSTRPDTIDNRRLDLIRGFPVSTIELGVQSMDDRVLAMARRGHTSADTEKAAALLKERDYSVGMQMMVGLPGDDEAIAMAAAHKIADLSPDFVRIYPTVVLADSLLARWYDSGKYAPMPLDECVTLVKRLYLFFRERKIPVIRMGLQASEDLLKEGSILAGPYHPAFGHLVHSEIFLDRASSVIESQNAPNETISISVHPRNISKMRGIRNRNIEILKNRFHISSIKVVSDVSLGEDELNIF
ncbi:radical SAM protein [Desulfobacterales bacterium HSG2]|nr:radical SAM protein [Desulfobacterales bacterium HSG2]